MKLTRLGDLARASAADIGLQAGIEEQIRDLVHREPMLARFGSQVHSVTDPNTFLEQFSSPTLQEIDRAISKLKGLREELLDREKRIQTEFREYQTAHDKASASLKRVEDILTQWRETVAPSPTPAPPNEAEEAQAATTESVH